MGGDHAPEEIVKGALLAVSEYPVDVLLVGQEEVVRKELAKGDSVRHIKSSMREVVEMDDNARHRCSGNAIHPSGVRQSRRRGRADAFVSAGTPAPRDLGAW
jgi:glycerol-3-phosphate acyltransferase PlsX